MRWITFAGMTPLCSGCLEPRTCLELYTCPPDGVGEAADGGERSESAADTSAESDPTDLETMTSSTAMDGAVPTSPPETDAGSVDSDSGTNVCGDGLFGPGEVCDDGNTVDEEACTYGQATCVACNATCSEALVLTGPTCGDGIVSDGEACDENAAWCDNCKITRSIAAGGAHSCTVLETGEVSCWGRGTYGQLGSGVARSQNVPVQVKGLRERAQRVALGTNHSCALLVDGGVQCWGDGVYGQLGHGQKTQQLAPVDVEGLASGATAIVASGDHTCVLLINGEVACWGSGHAGQLGNGETEHSTVPVGVEGLMDVSALAAGEVHTCAVLTGGTVKCWGAGTKGQLGDGQEESSSVPVAVSDLNDVVSVGAGAAHSCALLASGDVKCWGDSPALGEGHPTPTVIDGLTGSTRALSAGHYHTCAIVEPDHVECWGVGSNGQLGNGLLDPQPEPVPVAGLASVLELGAGTSHTCALADSGGISCWGSGAAGQLGNASDDSSASAVDVLGFD